PNPQLQALGTTFKGRVWDYMVAHTERMKRFENSIFKQREEINGSITTWEDLTTHFLAQFFPPGRTVKLRNDILMFQQHHGESLSEAKTRFKDLLQKVHHLGIDRWLQI
nr:zinc finger, CCHC-type [Tanacetum cinerariifolium]